jgi:hypothetical protein
VTRIAALAAALVLCLAAGARADFPQDPPNDPFYDQAETQPSDKCVDDEQIELFDFLPICAPLASDPEGSSGMWINRAWREFSIGEPEVVTAYIEAGINWHDDNARDLANQVYLNDGELPPPTSEDGDSALRASDFKDTRDANENGLVDPEDLIARYSDGRDDDGNGYVDDISGWDFYHDQNNPATYDSAYAHTQNQMLRLGAEANNGFAKAGVCPRCRILVVKAGAEALERTDDLAQSWLFAADSGATVINSETADLGYSKLIRRTAEYLHRRGITLVGSSNDFNSSDHQGGMFHPFALPGNGLVSDRIGTEQGTRLTRTYRERSSITSWGPHNMFSVPTNSGTTSASTPIVSGVVALLASYGREAARSLKIAEPLTGPEVVQVMRATASDIDDPSLAWPNKPGWDLQFGYGRPNVYKAAQAISKGDIPPLAAIDSPDWFELADPTQRQTVEVRGRVSAPRSGRYTWALQLGAGGEPNDGEFRTIASGDGTSARDGKLGRVDLRSVPREFWARAMELSRTKALETTERYTMTLRLVVTDGAGRRGEDRRAFYVHRDAAARAPFPKRIGEGGGDGQAALVDLQGQGRLAIVFGDTDGRVHALDSKTGRELPGWPVRTRANRLAKPRAGIPAGNEPVVANVAVGDLDADGRQWVVATSMTGRVYAWDSRGVARRGFPRPLAKGVVRPETPRKPREYTRLPAEGAFAAPVLGDLDGDRRLEVVQAAWDGRLHVFKGSGGYLPGWPVKVELPAGYQPPEGKFLVSDHKLQGTPALADLDGDGRVEIVQRSQWTDINQPDISPLALGHLHAYGADGKPVPGWPVTMRAVAEAYGTAQEFITEGTNSPVAADVDGDGDDEVASNPVLSPSYLYDGDGRQLATYGPTPEAALASYAAGAQRATSGEPASDAPVGFTTSGAFGRFGGRLAFTQPSSGAAGIAATTLTPGLGTSIKNYERAHDARSGAALPNFPATLQGLNFIGAPLFADVTGDGQAEILDGGDSNTMHAFQTDGTQAPGFPKFTTGWTLFSPSAGDLDGDGRVELVSLTREGYLMVWRTQGRADGNAEWWRWHHDERSSGRYGSDTRPPAGIPKLKVDHPRPPRAKLTFRAPGDDWSEGTAARYEVFASSRPITQANLHRARRLAVTRKPRPGRSVDAVIVTRPKGARYFAVRAVDEAGNAGPIRVR